jgi:hypothetical protein
MAFSGKQASKENAVLLCFFMAIRYCHVSGYHMAVVAGVVFFAVRALLALIPGLTVSAPIKKWSAAAALLAAAFYLLLSGAERSFFIDRRGPDRRHGRSPCHHLPDAGGRGAGRAPDRAGSAGSSEFSDVVCGNAGPGGAGADWHAADVCDA